MVAEGPLCSVTRYDTVDKTHKLTGPKVSERHMGVRPACDRASVWPAELYQPSSSTRRRVWATYIGLSEQMLRRVLVARMKAEGA